MEESGKKRSLVVIDGSNAAAGGGFRPPKLARVMDARAAAANKWPTAEIVIVVDAQLRHALSPNDQTDLATHCRDGLIISTPSCTLGKGDAVILAIAGAHDGIVVSNDGFREHLDVSPFLVDDDRVFGLVAVDGLGTFLLPRKLQYCAAR